MRRTSLLIIAMATTSCRAAPQGPAPHSTTPASVDGALNVETVARGLEHPWGIAIMPDSRMLVTERPGRLRIVERDGRLSAPLTGVPRVFAEGQGGLLDVALDPAFARNHIIYLSYAEPGEGGTAGTAVARAHLMDAATGLDSVRVIYRQEPKVGGGNHFGSRVVFAPDGRIFITQGERFEYRDQAQNLRSLLGKLVRINADGTIPKDNPFVGRNDARPEIWSYGHRNMQGAAIHPVTGQLWTIEHGARGGDELNHPEPGRNYGWPVITYGRDYSGMRIGEGTVKEGMEQPVFYWDPVIAPSGITFYTGDKFPGWKNDLLIGSLQPGALVRVRLQNGAVVLEERYLGDLRERIRDVQQGNDGLLYLITDSGNGRVLRVSPK
ncbi:MAG TPA: PQQ-dependent sugar dehydrogenase [Gemmatimonadaceae bacterium]|nr:PQQ-dependent sugar dehydrogenase [Gemmatimonadaceae bacterium]